MIEPDRVVGGLLGVAVGDALGRVGKDDRREDRVPEQPPAIVGGGPGPPAVGVWSDKTCLTFSTAGALLDDYSVDHLGSALLRCLEKGEWTPDGHPLEVDEATLAAIDRLRRGVLFDPADSEAGREGSDSQCPMKRMLPVALAFSRWSIPLMLEKVHGACRITHADPLCQMACGVYALIVRNLAFRRSVRAAYRSAAEYAKRIYVGEPWLVHRHPLRRFLRGTLDQIPKAQISGEGSAVGCLEAAVWSLQTTRGLEACVLQALEVAGDADPVVSVAGGLAGVAYGYDAIPQEWIDSLARKDDLLRVARRFADRIAL